MGSIEYKELPGRGVGAIATSDIASGHVVLSELPLLVYPQHSAIPHICSHCLRFIDNQASSTPCPTCSTAKFCSHQCASAALQDPGSHCTLVCQTTTACNISGHTDEHLSQLHFLIRATSLLLAASSGNPIAGSRASQLSSLSSRGPVPLPSHVLHSLHSWHHEALGRITHAFKVSSSTDISSIIDVGAVAVLLERDAVNGYGITMPLSFHSTTTTSMNVISDDIVHTTDENTTTTNNNNNNNASQEIEEHDASNRPLRGTALYSHASRINHECLPNVARFDDFDAPSHSPGDNMVLSFRTMHALPAGEELTQSYFPLPWTFVERQTRLADQFGFQCVCPRCREESSWPRNEHEEALYQSGAVAQFQSASTPAVIPHAQQDHQADPAYIHLFLLKYVCPEDECSGTMAPAEGDESGDVYCNVCGRRRSEQEFMEEVERDMQQ